MLSCSCSEDYNDEPGAWWFYEPTDFVKFSAKKRKRCKSCSKLIDIDSDCLEFQRERNPYTDIEQRIKGDVIGIAPYFMCESCGEIYLNLSAVGYCMSPADGMPECLNEYQKITKFKKAT